MIVERIRKLLKEKKLSAKDMLIALNINKDSLKRWEASEKEGKPIKEIYLNAVASYLNTTVDYLLGKTDNPASSEGISNDMGLSDIEIRLIRAYRENADMQSAVNKLLGIETEKATGSIADDIEKIITDFIPARQSTDTK